jgi:hypothetical protein
MMSITVVSALKQTDLHALSALEAIHQLLGVKALRRLSRLSCWRFGGTVDKAALTGKIRQLLDETYYLINPNKETASVNTWPTDGTDLHSVWVQVFNRTFKEVPEKEHIAAKLRPVSVDHIEKSTIWGLQFEPHASPDFIRSALLPQILETRSHSQGLLVHPLLETHRMIDPAAFF